MSIRLSLSTVFPFGQNGGAKGFTLIEVMIITAIIGIVSAVAVPNYSKWHSKYQLRQAATEINNQFNLARMVAMNRNSTVTVTVSLVGSSVTISATDATGVQAFVPQAMMSHVIGVTGAPVTVSFTSLGLRSGGGAGNQVIAIQNDGQQTFNVVVSPSGKVTNVLY
jgi:prepilin-type N-terminal cleavage/methylation domain-containing protein